MRPFDASRPSHVWGVSLSELVTALGNPQVIAQALRAQWQLRSCYPVPKTVRLRGRAFVENRGQIVLGERVRIDARTVPVELVAHEGATLTIGSGTYINYGASISAHERVTLGTNCLVGNYVLIMDSDYHDLKDHTKPGRADPIVIEDDVWIGTRATVLKGVRIGRGSVVGAASLVTTDIPPHTLAFGVPARAIKQL